MSFPQNCIVLLAQKSLHLSHTYASYESFLRCSIGLVCLVVSKCSILHVTVLLSSSQVTLFPCGDCELQFFWLHDSYELNGSKPALFGMVANNLIRGGNF